MVDPPVGGVIAYTVLSPALTTVEFVALMMFVMFPQTIPALVPILI